MNYGNVKIGDFIMTRDNTFGYIDGFTNENQFEYTTVYPKIYKCYSSGDKDMDFNGSYFLQIGTTKWNW